VATPIGGSLNERTVALRPPNPASVSRPSSASSASSAPVAQSAEGIPKSLQVGTIYFSDGSAKLSRKDRSILQAVSDVFQKMGGRVRVIGHSSMGAWTFNSSRREAVNFKMSLKRANAVANELIRQGIPSTKVEVVAEGDRAPVFAETSQTGAAHNRRTEIFIDYLERS
jgi:outer membrane protein OmpA-like peptidoglycan-associated protein